jgi:fructan beta-fructosidase
MSMKKAVDWLLLCTLLPATYLGAQSKTIAVTKQYLNIPVASAGEKQLYTISVGGIQKRSFPVQLAEHAPDYWIFLDVSEFKGNTITVAGPADHSSPALQAAFDRIYQADQIEGAATLYKERDRPAFHFTVKRGWTNDVNGPIFLDGQYHLFWQAYPFGLKADVGYMYWGHAVGKDLVHWKELSPALIPDKLGGVWSGTSLIDHNNAGGWGKDALVIFYTAYDPATHKQVQCIAYSTDRGTTFTRYSGNPVIDTNTEVGSNDTRDPKVFWYEPAKHWVLVLFEKDGMSIFNGTDLKHWTRKSHLRGFQECPDLFTLPLDGDSSHEKWILHGGSSAYMVGSFDGEAFTPETPVLHYAEGKNLHGEDVLYAAESFVEMPDGRRVQMAWGRIPFEGMPFNQMHLFPTEFRLKTTSNGPRMQATPVAEIANLRGGPQNWSKLTVADTNQKLAQVGSGPLDVRLQVSLAVGDALQLSFHGSNLATIPASDLESGRGQVEVLLDKGIAEIFVNNGARYITREITTSANGSGLELDLKQPGSAVDALEVYRMESMWKP